MAIQSRRNQYRGINAHLHSVLQNEPYDWESFHSEHLGHLRDALQMRLPDGYFARLERSLQVRARAQNGEPRPARTRPDIFISRAKTLRRSPLPPAAINPAQPASTIAIARTLSYEDADYLDAVMIYRVEEGGRIGIPVTRLELLSPANKPPRSGHTAYLIKREDTLRAGICLVELDYLHQTRPPLGVLPSYPDREPDAAPYLLLVSDPRPSLDDGLTQIFPFAVDDPLPSVAIPLADDDTLTFDFGAVYNHTFASNPYYRLVVDYEQPPERLDTYSPSDQARILARMRAISAAQRQGLDLEQGPFPIPDADAKTE